MASFHKHFLHFPTFYLANYLFTGHGHLSFRNFLIDLDLVLEIEEIWSRFINIW